MAGFWDKWGHYLLAALCVLVILLSGLWTRSQQDRDRSDAQALNDTSQRLGQTEKPAEIGESWERPCEGAVIRPYSDAPQFFPALGLWRVHQAVDFAAGEGDRVAAMAAGTVEGLDGEIRIRQEDGAMAVYRGCGEILVHLGQRVRQGQEIGRAGDAVFLEGGDHVCVALIRDGKPLPFGNDWLTNP